METVPVRSIRARPSAVEASHAEPSDTQARSVAMTASSEKGLHVWPPFSLVISVEPVVSGTLRAARKASVRRALKSGAVDVGKAVNGWRLVITVPGHAAQRRVPYEENG